MKLRFRTTFAWLLLVVLMLPIIAACGAPQGGATTEETTPAVSEPVAEATEAPVDEAPVEEPVVTEAPVEEPIATEAPVEEPIATGGPLAEPEVTEATVDETATVAETAMGEEETEAPAVTDEATETAAEVNPEYLVWGNEAEPDTLDTMNTTAGSALLVGEQILETLVGFEPGGFEIIPALATEWSANEDSTEWTFKLREGVTFHDGTPFNADAVVFNFSRLADPEFEFGFRAVNEGDPGNTFPIFPQIFGAYAGEENTLWEGIEAVDESTVKITLTKPLAILPDLLAASYFGISSPDAVKEAGLQYGTPEVGAVGTGAFVFEEWRAGESISLSRNEDYWDEPARMPGLAIRIIPDTAQRQAELENGSIDFTKNLSPDFRDTVANNPDLQIVDLEPFNVAYLSIDMTAKPLDDVRVRQALAHAIDKQEILDGLYGGVGTVADDFLPDALAWARPENLEKYEYNPERAMELLAEAGYPEGFSTVTLADGTEVPLELWYMPVARPYNPVGQALGELQAAQLADIGVQVELKTEDWATYLDNYQSGKKHGLVQLGWTGDYLDPNNFLYTHMGPGNEIEAGYANQELWDILARAGGAANQEEAAELFKEAGTIINRDMPRIPLVHAPPVYAARAGLEGWEPSPFGGEPFASVFIEK